MARGKASPFAEFELLDDLPKAFSPSSISPVQRCRNKMVSMIEKQRREGIPRDDADRAVKRTSWFRADGEEAVYASPRYGTQKLD
jgi:hypothetical protein